MVRKKERLHLNMIKFDFNYIKNNLALYAKTEFVINGVEEAYWNATEFIKRNDKIY